MAVLRFGSGTDEHERIGDCAFRVHNGGNGGHYNAADATALASSNHHRLTVARSATYACGWNAFGQCGVDSTSGTRVGSATRIAFFDEQPGPVQAVAAGGWHSLFLTTSGDIYSCGSGAHGQLGHPYPVSIASSEDDDPFLVVHPLGTIPPAGCCSAVERVPRLIQSLALPMDEAVIAIAAGDKHSACVTEKGRVLVWGQACLPAPMPAPTASSDGVAEAVTLWGVQRYTPRPTEVPIAAMLAQLNKIGSDGGTASAESCTSRLVDTSSAPTRVKQESAPLLRCGNGWTAVNVDLLPGLGRGTGASNCGRALDLDGVSIDIDKTGHCVICYRDEGRGTCTAHVYMHVSSGLQL